MIPRCTYIIEFRRIIPRVKATARPPALYEKSTNKCYSSIEQLFGLPFFSFPFSSASLLFFLLFPLLFSLTVRTTVYILSPMQHARVSDYSKTAHVPRGSGSQSTHLHSFSLSGTLSCLMRVLHVHGTARRKHMHEHRRPESLSRSIWPIRVPYTRLATMHPTWHFRPDEESVVAALSVESLPPIDTVEFDPGNLETRKIFLRLPSVWYLWSFVSLERYT